MVSGTLRSRNGGALCRRRWTPSAGVLTKRCSRSRSLSGALLRDVVEAERRETRFSIGRA